MSVETLNKSVLIEGDKTNFISKGAIERLKRDLKNDDKEKLENNDYFKEDWTYKLLSNENNEIKIKIVHKNEITINDTVLPRILESNERRNMLKKKLKEMTSRRGNVKTKFNSTIPKELVDAYLELKKFKLPTEIPNPEQVLENKEQYKDIIHTMVQSFGSVKGNNPIVNYYKLLAKHLDIPTTPMSLAQQQQLKQQMDMLKNKNPEELKQLLKEKLKNPSSETNSFFEQLQEKRNIAMQNEVGDEMKKIYASMGLDSKVDEGGEEEDDTDISDILEKMGIKPNKDICLD